MSIIVTEERRSPGGKFRPPHGGCSEKRAGSVELLARATSPRCAVLLDGPLLRAITTTVVYDDGPTL